MAQDGPGASDAVEADENVLRTVIEESRDEYRPKMYYGDGSFDAPSSESGDGDDFEVYGEKDVQAPTNDAENEGLLSLHRPDIQPKKQV